MADTKMSGSLDLKSASAESVAFDLMLKIIQYETGHQEKVGNRDYWLKLYAECLDVVRNGHPGLPQRGK